MVGNPRRRWRRRWQDEQSGPRRLGCFWPLFWLILLIVLLGLLFGGYRKGTKASAPQRVVPVISYSNVYSGSEYTGTYPLG